MNVLTGSTTHRLASGFKTEEKREAIEQHEEPPAAQDPVDQPPKKDASKLTVPPNNRHHWDPEKVARVRRFRNVLIPLIFRTKDSGFEKIPTDGNYIVGPTHQSMFDAVLASRISDDKPFGSMSDVNQFKGVLGQMLSDYGSFPVDRWGEYDGDFPDPVDHSVEILNEGKNFIFYPEGRVYPDPHVNPLKTGVGRISMAADVKYALPVAQHYEKDTEFHPLETLVGVALSAGATAAGIWAANQGGAASTAAGVLTGLVGGALVGGGIGFALGPKDNIAKRGIKAAKWAGAFALGTAIAGGAASSVAPGVAPWLIGTTSTLTGAAGLGMTYHWTHRQIAHTRVGDPIPTAPYKQAAAEAIAQGENPEDANWKQSLRLVRDFHEALKKEKTALTGIESPFRMDLEGKEWGKQPDGTWVRVERNADKEWVPINQT